MEKSSHHTVKNDLLNIISRNSDRYIAALLAYAIALEKQMAKAPPVSAT